MFLPWFVVYVVCCRLCDVIILQLLMYCIVLYHLCFACYDGGDDVVVPDGCAMKRVRIDGFV